SHAHYACVPFTPRTQAHTNAVTVQAADLCARRRSELDRSVAGIPNMNAPELTMIGPLAAFHRPTAPYWSQFIYREGQLAHIQVVRSAPGVSGAWITEETADALHVKPGDSLTFESFGE